jgi:serine/threonine-protein kinase
MAPEQFAGQAESVRSDIYSLGLVLYEMFTGKPAFKAATVAELSRMHRESNPTAPSTLVAAFDPAVERVILRCLGKDPEARPRSALAVAAALPGGDPLAAALAAGETPSPEMVAAAGETGGLAPKVAWACLAAIAACLVAAVALSSATSLFSFVALPKTPDALCDRGREIIRRLGYTADPKDSARGFALSDYIVYLSEHDRSPGRWERLRAGEPPAALFWYRQSPRALQTTDIWGRVTLNQPPQLVSGMITVLLDPEGRLVKFDAVPPQVEERDKAGRQPDWAALIAETGLDFAALRPAPSAWTPPVYADTRAAWEGTYPKQPDVPIRIEAAAAGGKPVYFQVFEPWSRPRRMEEALPSLGVRVANALVSVIITVVLAAALGLARHNLRLGRGDRKGALRISVSLLMLIGTARHLGASYAPDVNQQLFVFMSVLGASLVNAAFIWIGYVALEPHVRRIWPHTIISWSRLLAGQFRDHAAPASGCGAAGPSAAGSALRRSRHPAGSALRARDAPEPAGPVRVVRDVSLPRPVPAARGGEEGLAGWGPARDCRHGSDPRGQHDESCPRRRRDPDRVGIDAVSPRALRAAVGDRGHFLQRSTRPVSPDRGFLGLVRGHVRVRPPRRGSPCGLRVSYRAGREAGVPARVAR